MMNSHSRRLRVRVIGVALTGALLQARPALGQGVSAYRAGPDNDSTSVRVTAFPSPPYVERGRGGEQYVQVDFQIRNLTSQPLLLRRIVLSVLDDRGQVVHQQFVATGTSATPGINTIPKLDAAANQELGVFNPFFVFEPDLPLARLRYRFLFDAQGSGRQYESTVMVEPVEYRPQTSLTLPIKGRMLVYDGHDFYSHHRRIDTTLPALRAMRLIDVPVRYANDLCVVNEAGDLYRGDPGKPQNWLSYGAPVYAPGAGRVVSAANDVQDNAVEKGRLVMPSGGPQDFKSRVLGSHIIIDHGNGEYSNLSHLKAGSVTVKVGDSVARGQRVGEIGFSGDTGFHVHLHYHLTSGAELTGSRALPLYFADFRRLLGTKTRTIKLGRIDTGDVVESIR